MQTTKSASATGMPVQLPDFATVQRTFEQILTDAGLAKHITDTDKQVCLSIAKRALSCDRNDAPLSAHQQLFWYATMARVFNIIKPAQMVMFSELTAGKPWDQLTQREKDAFFEKFTAKMIETVGARLATTPVPPGGRLPNMAAIAPLITS
ncbi:MAG TPA: hypothetical protein VN457_08115, partial [Chlamydiales bacterium]|nr:hypothetical protein [Chlamydiales bacterium]